MFCSLVESHQVQPSCHRMNGYAIQLLFVNQQLRLRFYSLFIAAASHFALFAGCVLFPRSVADLWLRWLLELVEDVCGRGRDGFFTIEPQ